jgi:hypothetical protein
VDKIDSGLCLVPGFSITGVEPSVATIRKLVTYDKICKSYYIQQSFFLSG